MEFVTNFTWIGFWVMNFTPKNVVYYIILILSLVIFCLKSSNLNIKPPVLHHFMSYKPTKLTKNTTTEQLEVYFKQTQQVHRKFYRN